MFQERSWYIIPAELVVGQGSIALYPKLKGAKYGPYKEAWHLLRKGLPAATHWVDLIQACVEEGRLSWWERIGVALSTLRDGVSS